MAHSDQSLGCALGTGVPAAAAPRESRRRTPAAPARKRATSPAMNCGPIATARSLISSCTPLATPRYTRMGAIPATVFTLLARPLPAKTRLPAASWMSTHESAEKLMRRCARPIPAVASASAPAPEAVPLPEAAAAPGSADPVVAGAGDEAREVGISPLIAGDAAGAAEDSAAPLAGAVLGLPARLRSFAGAAAR